VLVTACDGGSNTPTSDVVSVVPWGAGPNDLYVEMADYVLKNDDGESTGRGTLRVATQGSQVVLVQRFTSGDNSDESSVTVDRATLKPISSTRKIVTEDETEELQVTYTEAGASIRQGERQSGLSVPEHSYDNDSSLFLWRTLPFAPGYEAAYTTIITNRRSRQKVDLRVVDRETVRVPAGEFTAWRLEIRTSNAKQTAWYADTPARQLVRYDNDRGTIFELER
jgi:hypothetical protein